MPVPLLSGDVLLALAGVLIVKGSISPWEFFPPAFVAEVAGVMTGHFWSRTLGQRGLEALAGRVRARKALDRTSARLKAAGPLHITIARLVPGLRINTTLVAGAAGISAGTFLLGVVPAIIIWLAAYTLLGVVVGVPVLASLNYVQHVAVTGVVLVLIGLDHADRNSVHSAGPAAWRRLDPSISPASDRPGGCRRPDHRRQHRFRDGRTRSRLAWLRQRHIPRADHRRRHPALRRRDAGNHRWNSRRTSDERAIQPRLTRVW